MSKPIASIAILVAVFLAAMWVHAQTISVGPGGQGGGVFAPTVIAGPDLGFRVETRVETRDGMKLVGRLVARVDGKWVEVEDAVGVKKLTTR